MPRNSQQTALIGIPRNDENRDRLAVACRFLKFHNAVVDACAEDGALTDPAAVFDKAQRIVRWHYQWVILHEFLPKTVGGDVVQRVLRENPGPPLPWRNEPFMPVEFVAAYRFGHSQVRPGYRVNSGFAAAIFNSALNATDGDPADLRGASAPARRLRRAGSFFAIPGTNRRQQGKEIDTHISSPLVGSARGCAGKSPSNAPGSAVSPSRSRSATCCAAWRSACPRARPWRGTWASGR